MNRWRAEYDDGIWRFYRDGIELPFSLKGDIVVDALNDAESRIAELEAENERLSQLLYECKALEAENAELKADLKNARIAELEGKIDQLTAHSDIERQDDKWIPEVQE